MQSRLLQAVNRLGYDFESQGDWQKAAVFYQRSLEVNDLAEETYQRLMRCLLRQGRNAEALSAYNRCKNTLQAVLGLQPSPETQAIYRSISAGGSTLH